MNYFQYGSSEIQSQLMLNILKTIEMNRDKKYFIVAGNAGSGCTTMLNYINKAVFNNLQTNLFEGIDEINPEMSSALISTTKENVNRAIKMVDKTRTLVIEMPDLADRKPDIISAANFFIQVLSLMNNKGPHKLTDKAAEKLLQYNWPGNFHEFESVLEQAFENSSIQDSKATIEPEHISLTLPAKELEFSIGQKLDEVERKYILQTLYFVQQNRTKAAEILGISIRTLRNKINLYREEGYL